MKRARLARLYEYRLVWRYKGSASCRYFLAQQPSRILRRLKRIGSERPWEGVTVSQLRRSWTHLHLRLEVPWETVAPLSAREVLTRIRALYPALDFIRVEWRQVGEWTEMLDPIANLRTPTTVAAEHRIEQLLTKVDSMTPEDLDNWRLVPPAVRGDMRPSTQRRRPSYHVKTGSAVGGQSRRVGGAAATPARAASTGGRDDA